MKYVMLRHFAGGLETPVFCLAPTTHEELKAAHTWHFRCEVVSAGFVEFLPSGVRTFGHSDTLGLHPREQDARLIAAFYKHTLAMAYEAEARGTAPAAFSTHA